MAKNFTVLFDHSTHAHGGGSSFLQLLKNEFVKRGIYTSEMKNTDIAIFNSHHSAAEVLRQRRLNKSARFIQRVDGPMSVYNKPNDPRDLVVSKMGAITADGLIFQSNWSHLESKKLGLVPDLPYSVIINAPDSKFFFPVKRELSVDKKLRILGTSWSSNPNKGFSTYEWLDKNLDFNRFEITLYGKVPGLYKNIKVFPPVGKDKLAEVFKDSHIYLMPSRFEACSNALLEAIHSGLPTLTYAGSSNIELVTDVRLLFRNDDEIPAKLDEIIKNYHELSNRCELPNIEAVADQYIEFASKIVRKDRVSNWQLLWQGLFMKMKRI